MDMYVFKPTKYELLADREISGTVFAKKGEIVYDMKGYDYGLSSDDERYTGLPHKTVTLSDTGDYPGFTVPARDLKKVVD